MDKIKAMNDWQQDNLMNLPWSQKCLVLDGQQENKQALQCQVPQERGRCRQLFWSIGPSSSCWQLLWHEQHCKPL